MAENAGGSLNWMNCGLCADERGANDALEGVSRGANESDDVLVIPTR